MRRIVRSGGELTITFGADVDAAEVQRFVQLEQQCGGAIFDITFSASPSPTAHYRTGQADLFPVLADLARYFDVPALSPTG